MKRGNIMKHIIGVVVIGLLVGCTSTEPINGIYIVDAKYTSIHWCPVKI
jgi:type IV pilus biogenesis protein CpaD/CtpE